MSTSAYPSAVSAASLGKGTLALPATVFIFDNDSFGPPWYSDGGVRVLTDGDLQDYSGGGAWTDVDGTQYWIDEFISDVASDYEVQLSKTSGTDPVSGPSLGSFHTISTTRQWVWTNTIETTQSFSGTLTVREIADTSNSVSCGVSVNLTNGSF